MNNKKIVTIADRISVKVKENPYEKKSRIIAPEIADSAQTYYLYAVVEHIGDEVKNIKVGDELYFSKHAGYPVNLLLEQWYVIREADVLALIENK